MLVKHVRVTGDCVIKMDGVYLQKQPIATIVVTRDEGKIKIGTSICCPKDRFNKKLGTAIALGRALNGSEPKYPNRFVRSYDSYLPLYKHIVAVIRKEEEAMLERAKRYYKC